MIALEKYLKEKPLFYTKIDYSRMPNAYKSIKMHIKLPKIIQIVGTNGKGSTGRFLSLMLMQKNLSIGHYTSPHIFKFNERIWINGRDISDEELEQTHQELQSILSDKFKESLSYFEYTSFLAVIFLSKRCDYIVLEAGLGGEYDATSVFPKVLSVITPIGYDHSSFLGDSIYKIATTKIKSIDTCAILSRQYNKNVYKITKDISRDKDSELFLAEEILNTKEIDGIKKIVSNNSLADFQTLNLQTALSACKILKFNINLSALKISTMLGRCQKISKNITIDVGHNKMAAEALVEYFKDNKIILIYNSFKDKEYEQILKIFKPIIREVQILDIENERKMATKEIPKICEIHGIKCKKFKQIIQDREYLVFGSFLVVEKFLKDFA